jgi:outer membrane protein OmpA-like peptidoglycan-associated protein/uncharacterized protein YidB (DUF937 family)
MSLFDSLIGEVASRFGLGAQSGPLVMSLLKYMTGDNAGGLSGFLGNFTKAGLGDLASSWISRGDNSPMSVDQLTSALGGDAISKIAGDAGVSADQAKPALAYMLPRVVDTLTPDGTVPTSLPDTVMSFLKGGLGAAAGAAAGAVGVGADALRSGVGAATNMAGSAANLAGDAADAGGSMLFKLLPLLALALLAFLGYKYCATDDTHVATAPNTNAAKPATSPVAGAKMIDSSLVIVNKDGKYTVSGVVPSEAAKAELEAALKAAYGEGKYDISGVKIDANAKAPDWWGKLKDILPALAVPGAIFSVNGPDIKLEGVPAAVGQGLLDKLKGFFGTGFNFSLAKPIDDAAAATIAEEAEKKALSALAALPANFTPAQLVEALNLEIINFKSGDSVIPKDREDLLIKSAEYIKKLPADAKIEVGGHTDSRGAAATNLALSQKRADAVKAFLAKNGVNAAALTTKGYGPDKPVASNDTEEGRFQNRRIEFTVGK